jgi:hypothetical protein
MRETPLVINAPCARLGARNGVGARWTSRGPATPGVTRKKISCNGSPAPFFCFPRAFGFFADLERSSQVRVLASGGIQKELPFLLVVPLHYRYRIPSIALRHLTIARRDASHLRDPRPSGGRILRGERHRRPSRHVPLLKVLRCRSPPRPPAAVSRSSSASASWDWTGCRAGDHRVSEPQNPEPKPRAPTPEPRPLNPES